MTVILDAVTQAPSQAVGKAGVQYVQPTSNGAPVAADNPMAVGSVAASVAVRIDNSAINSQPLYVGTALPGSVTSAKSWRVQKLLYDANGALSAVLWANVSAAGVPSSSEIWDNRATLSYS